MADTYKRLNTTTTFSSGAGTTIYTVPGATTALVRKVQVINPGSSAGTVKLHHVPSGGAAGNGNIILPTVSLGVNEHGVDEAPFAMATGDFIVAVGDGTNTITINIHGIEVA
jgi:hypothetical protein